ncbi:MAG: HAD-IIB family hydrolase [Myxococcales bacterium]|nr:HAD-IIB family hydrolase [Myxococcales bacterium]
MNPESANARTPGLLAVDLDGTLLDGNGQPHASDLHAMRALSRTGVPITIITGRLYSGTRPTAVALGLTGPVGCVDGSHLVSASTHTTLMHHGIRGEHALKLRDALAASGAATFVFARDAIVHDHEGEPFLSYVVTWSKDVERTDRVADHHSWENEDGITAVVALGTVQQIASSVEAIQADVGDAAQVAMFPVRRAGGGWGMVVRGAGGNKGSALEWIAAHYGVGIEQTVAVGDWLNDVPMLKTAGHSFAMGQAPDDVKRAAGHVLTETSETGGGIARIVNELFGVR